MKIFGLSILLAALVASLTFAAVESSGNHLRNLRKGNKKKTNIVVHKGNNKKANNAVHKKGNKNKKKGNKNKKNNIAMLHKKGNNKNEKIKIAVKRVQVKFWNWLFQNGLKPTGDVCFQDQSLGAPGVFFGAEFWNPGCDETLIPTRFCVVDVKDDFMVPVGMNGYCAPGKCLLGDVTHPNNPHGDCDTYGAAKQDCKLYDNDGMYGVGTATLNGRELPLYKATTDSFYVPDNGVVPGVDDLRIDKGFTIGYYAYIEAGTMLDGSTNILEIVAEETDWDFDGECDALWSVNYVLNIVNK